MSVEKVIIQKNDRTQVRVSIDEFNDKTFLAIREYYMSGPVDAYSDDWLPTKKGVTLNLEFVDELIEGLQQLAEQLN
jgi:hypothetical protein